MQQGAGVALKKKVDLPKQTPATPQAAVDQVLNKVLEKLLIEKEGAPREGEARFAPSPKKQAEAHREKETDALYSRMVQLSKNGIDPATGMCYDEKGAKKKIEELQKELSSIVGTRSMSGGPDYIEYQPKPSRMNLWDMSGERIALWITLGDYLKILNSGKYDAKTKKSIDELTEKVKKSLMKDMKGALPTAEDWYKAIVKYTMADTLDGNSGKDDFVYFVAMAVREYDAWAKNNSGERVLTKVKKEGRTGSDLKPDDYKTAAREEFISLLIVLCFANGMEELHASPETIRMAREGISKIAGEKKISTGAPSELAGGPMEKTPKKL